MPHCQLLLLLCQDRISRNRSILTLDQLFVFFISFHLFVIIEWPLVLGVLLIIGSIAGIIICGIAGIISGFTFFLLGVIGCSVTLVISILLVVGVHKERRNTIFWFKIIYSKPLLRRDKNFPLQDNSKLVRPCVYYYAAHIIFTVIIMIVAIVKIMAVAAAVAAAVDGGGQISEQVRAGSGLSLTSCNNQVSFRNVQ